MMSTLWQIISMFTFSTRVALTMLILFNIPLLVSYIQSKRYSMKVTTTEEEHKEKTYIVYRWNTVFLYMYALRLIFIIISGFVFLLFLCQNDELSEFFCDRYSRLDYDDKTSKTEDEWETCIFRLRVWSWCLFIPLVAFQLHCYFTLIAYRLRENK